MLRGVEEGRYIVRFPDTVATCITSALAGMAAPNLPLWITVPLAPVVVCPLNSSGNILFIYILECGSQMSAHVLTCFVRRLQHVALVVMRGCCTAVQVLFMQVYRWMIQRAFWKINTQDQGPFHVRRKTS